MPAQAQTVKAPAPQRAAGAKADGKRSRQRSGSRETSARTSHKFRYSQPLAARNESNAAMSTAEMIELKKGNDSRFKKTDKGRFALA